ncbi:MAG: tRNA (adenosine(37)-N6)-dimethylallyltransferase MiaA [Coriobacteriia bacterium]|nr:tRNA (adenosine(37)-N6)-dimethylallyltransferase MiaA [Coriobacteriia bacterium]
MVSNRSDIIVICGPTATGKSEVANELAYMIGGEVLSADSMQIYKGMDIGTGKFLDHKVKHWGIDIVDPNVEYSAALYQEYARDVLDNAKCPIVICGGTGFYIRAAIDDYNFPKGEQTKSKYTNMDKDELWELLKDKDESSTHVIHKNNTVRVIRALEMADQGLSYADQLENYKNIKQLYPTEFYGIKVDRDTLNERIDVRVDKMLKEGLVDEVKGLLDSGYRDALTAASAIGYKEIVEYLDNKISLDEAISKIKVATHRYAKRQRTWFNKDKRINWIDYDKVQSLYRKFDTHQQ